MSTVAESTTSTGDSSELLGAVCGCRGVSSWLIHPSKLGAPCWSCGQPLRAPGAALPPDVGPGAGHRVRSQTPRRAQGATPEKRDGCSRVSDDGRGVVERPAATLGATLDEARARGLREVWVTAGELPESWRAAPGWEVRGPDGLGPWYRAWPAEHGDAIDVALPAYESRAPWRRAGSGAELLGEVRRFAEAAGLGYRWSPGATGAAMMRASRPEMPAPAGCPTLSPEEGEWVWARQLTKAERAAAGELWVCGWDVNGQYLAAAGSAVLGLGEPEHTTAPDVSLAMAERPGYWLCDAPRKRPGADPFHVVDAHRRRRWYATPTVKLAAQLGAGLTVREAWVWPEASRWLRPWYETVRDAREALGATTLAGQVLKRAANTAVNGWLAGGDVFEGRGAELHRPHWRHTIQATARANLYRRLAKVTCLAGGELVAVDVDTALYLSTEPGEPPVGMPVGAGLGQFKRAGVARLSDVLGCWDSPDPAKALTRELAKTKAGTRAAL